MQYKTNLKDFPVIVSQAKLTAGSHIIIAGGDFPSYAEVTCINGIGDEIELRLINNIPVYKAA